MHGLEARATELRASAKNKGGPGSGGREEGEEIALAHRIFVMAKSLPETTMILRLSGAGSQGKSGKIFAVRAGEYRMTTDE